MATKKPPTEERQQPLRPPENAQFRDMRDQWVFRTRLWKLIKTIAGWVGGIGLGIWLLGEKIVDLFTRGGPPQ